MRIARSIDQASPARELDQLLHGSAPVLRLRIGSKSYAPHQFTSYSQLWLIAARDDRIALSLRYRIQHADPLGTINIQRWQRAGTELNKLTKSVFDIESETNSPLQHRAQAYFGWSQPIKLADLRCTQLLATAFGGLLQYQATAEGEEANDAAWLMERLQIVINRQNAAWRQLGFAI